jgi:hypothetical protein
MIVAMHYSALTLSTPLSESLSGGVGSRYGTHSALRLSAERRQILFTRLHHKSASNNRQKVAWAGLLPSVAQRSKEVASTASDLMTAVVATLLCLFLF